MKKTCEQCGVEFIINENLKRERNKRFCCRLCAIKHTGINNKNKKHSLEEKLNKSENSKGILNNFYGKKHSTESLNKMVESSLWKEEKYKYCNLSENEKEIFDGLLISDGCLEKPSRISSRLSFGFKYIEILEKIKNDLPSIKFSDIVEYTSKPHKKTNKRYTNYWMKSIKYFNFLDEYKRWYNIKKIIPNDFRLTSLSCYWWYICDGYILEDNVNLCTDCFNEEDNLKLIHIFNKNNLYPTLTSRNRIYFNKEESQKFLNWVIIHNKNINIYNYKFKL